MKYGITALYLAFNWSIVNLLTAAKDNSENCSVI